MAILETLSCGSDLKKLNIDQLKTLAEEIRAEILKVTGENGGHLSSNLGVIEATIAIHYVFDLPNDKLIFDVGHQCYTHKILSGRKESFSSIRTEGGLSGFQCKGESEYDVFCTGHAGNSLSLSLGLCEARDKREEDYSVITFVGDGSFVNGLNLEAITATTGKPKNFIVVLNDNEMSISKNQNGLYKLISRHTSGRSYVRSKRAVKKVFGDSFIAKFLGKIKRFLKRLVGRNTFIEDSGFKYVGVLDGNDLKTMIKFLVRIKNVARDKAVLLHIKTTKGKGYIQAEERSDLYHGVGKNFCSNVGDFSATLGKKLCSKLENDSRVVAITCGMKDGTGLKVVEEKFPKNFHDVGIAEEYAVSFAAGLAAGGQRPVVAVYSTFLQRAYDQILHDVCLQNLPVIFCLDRAGLVGADGKTHQGVFDLSYLGHLPNMQIFAPSNAKEFEETLDYAFTLNNPVAIRYPNDKGVDFSLEGSAIDWQIIKDGNSVSILAVGPRMLSVALSVKEKISSVRVINARCVKPLDEKMLLKIKDSLVITLEENAVIGGFGEQVIKYYSSCEGSTKVKCFGIGDEFICHGSIDGQKKITGLSEDAVIEFIENYAKGEGVL